MYNGSDNKCHTTSPSKEYGCSLLSGHHRYGGSERCQNASSGVSWCGYCNVWECEVDYSFSREGASC